jgi:hypothetical protein
MARRVLKRPPVSRRDRPASGPSDFDVGVTVDLVRRYLLLGLRLGRHIDGFVDFYYGPAELAERVHGEEPAPPAALAAEARALAGSLDDLDDAQRERWFAEQLEGLTAVAERLDGSAMSYEEEVRRCFGIDLDPAAEDELAEAHRRLDELVPGAGLLGERYRAWRRDREVPPDVILPAAQALAAELRRRSDELFGLPEGESAAIELVANEPWAAFNYYLGGRRSRIAISTDVPIRAELLPDLVAHELYPGHHTQHALKEALLVDGRGRLEEAIAPVGTPQPLVDEGVAMNALEILGEDAEAACAQILAGFGAGYDVDLIRAVRLAEEPMWRIDDSAARMVHVEGRDLDEVRAYLQRWSLRPPDEVDKIIEFVTHPTWRAYVAVYETGRRLVKAWVGGDPARYRRLLTEQLPSADLH